MRSLSMLRKCPRGQLRMTRGRFGFLLRHRDGPAPAILRRPVLARFGSLASILACQKRICVSNHRCWSHLMSLMGQKRRFLDIRATSAFPLLATYARTSRIGRFVPRADIGRACTHKIRHLRCTVRNVSRPFDDDERGLPPAT